MQTFFTQDVSFGALLAALYSDPDTFYQPTVTPGEVEVAPDAYANEQAFFTQTVEATYELTPALYSNGNQFYTHLVEPGEVALLPSLYANMQGFYTHEALGLNDVLPGHYANTQAFYGVTIDLLNTVLPALYGNAQGFYSHVLEATYEITFALHENGQTFPAATVAPGAVTVLPPHHVNVNVTDYRHEVFQLGVPEPGFYYHYCQRSGFRIPYWDAVRDGEQPSLIVQESWRDQDHPQKYQANVAPVDRNIKRGVLINTDPEDVATPVPVSDSFLEDD